MAMFISSSTYKTINIHFVHSEKYSFKLKNDRGCAQVGDEDGTRGPEKGPYCYGLVLTTDA